MVVPKSKYSKTTLNDVIRVGKIIDNKRTRSLNMKDALEIMAEDTDSFKCAVGYFYIEGLFEIINSLKDLKEIKILMGSETSKPTKEILISAFKASIDKLEFESYKEHIKLFYELVNQYKTLKIKVYFGTEKDPERLHSKAYLFLRDRNTKNILNKYKAGIIGSSNLTPSGLVGNTELNTIITEPSDLENLEEWFDNLWDKGTEDFERLKISDAIIAAIKESKFREELQNHFSYIEPKEFIKILIKYLNADYLFEEFKKSKLLQFQYVDFIRILNNFNSKGYRGCFLTSSVGLGKSYVASQVAKYFLNNDKRVLIIAPAGLVHNKDQWQRYLKEFGIYDKVKLVSMGDLQKKPEQLNLKKYINNYGLIIVDEVHNYRNPDVNRTRNLKKIIDENGDSKILFLTATPINTNLDDLLNLVKLFYRNGQNLFFDKIIRELKDIIEIFKNKEKYEELNDSDRNKLSLVQEEIEQEIFIKSTRETIKTSVDYIEELRTFAGVDITKMKDPEIKEVKYELDSKYKDIVNNIVDFITSLSAAHLRLLDPEKGVRLGGFFKWILYKRFESDISSYYLTLKRLSKRNLMILSAIEKQNTKYLDENEYDEEFEEDIDITFNLDFKDKLNDVIKKIKSGDCAELLKILEDLKKDVAKINLQIQKLEPFLKDRSKILFKNDQKINQLNSILNYNKNKKILIFTEYKDTLNAIKEYFKTSLPFETVRFVDSNTKNKFAIIDKFNNPRDKLKILITTDTLSEGFNISGADMVINFDVPYNPVKIIQRIGRATRLDTPKEIEVLNFRPDDDLDIELKLVETLELRIKDIIRFVGVEYRIWFETEKELLTERRRKDKKIYIGVIRKIRSNIREGNFNDLETSISYSKPILIFLQKAIKEYNLKKEELENINIPSGNNFTLFNGKNGLSIIYKDTDSYNQQILLDKKVVKLNKNINFENKFEKELKQFRKYFNNKKKEDIRQLYFNNSVDKLVNYIVDFINSEKIKELFPTIINLETKLKEVNYKCGSTTEKTLKKIKIELQEEINGKITKNKIKQWVDELEDSFTKSHSQQKIFVKQESIFAIGFVEE